MAGIVAWVASEPQPTAFGPALDRLCHGRSFRSAVHADGPALKVGSSFRGSTPTDVHEIQQAAVLAVIYGSPLLRRGGWSRATAAMVSERFIEEGRESLFELDGSFVVLVVDRRARQMHFVNDRIGSIPHVRAQRQGVFAAAPEAKALPPLLGEPLEMDPAALVSFLNLGYPLGEQTMFEAVSLLEPATCLTVCLDTAAVGVERYWDLRFSASPGVALRDAANDLQEVMRDSIRGCLVDSPPAVGVLLTGGLDSRALLGTMVASGRPPDWTATWGVRGDIPESDPAIARSLSDEFGVPHRFLRYGAETVARNAEAWAAVSELSSDNGGNFAAGASFMVDEGLGDEAVVMIGDQMFGPGGLPGTLVEAEQAITRIEPGRMLPALDSLFNEERSHQARGMLRAQLSRLVAQAGSGRPKDVQDYLFLHLYVFRWLCAAAYFREPMVEPRRPFMLGSVIDFVSSLPPRLRVDKTVLVAALKASMPRLASFPAASADSLIDWGFEMRRPGPLRELVRGLVRQDVLGATPLGGMLDGGSLDAFTARFFAADPRALARTPSVVPKVFALRRLVTGNGVLGGLARHVEPFVRKAVGVAAGVGDARVVLRLAQISLLQRAMRSDQFRVPRGTDGAAGGTV